MGARPLAITDCLNFGNPERGARHGPVCVGCIEGMADACRALDFPVVSGNVSFYNETEGTGILPTPSVGGLGLIADLERTCDPALKAADEALLLVGGAGGHLARSLYQREIEGREEGPPPAVDLAAERRHGDFVRRQIESGRVSACHDISDGGLLVALAEMALAALDAGRTVGARIAVPAGAPSAVWLFGEDQARYLLSAPRGPGRGARGGGRECGRSGRGHRVYHWRGLRRDRRGRVDSGRRKCHIDSSAPPHPRRVAAGLHGRRDGVER